MHSAMKNNNHSQEFSGSEHPPLTQRPARAQRYVDFHEFLARAPAHFSALCQSNEIARRFDAIYRLCVTPGGRDGGLDKRRLEVFFGHRPYDVQEKYDSAMTRGLRVLTERGATLEYVQDDLGRVHCFLYPASSEGMKPLEDVIRLTTVQNPKNLCEREVQSHFRSLVAYMQCTCLDGEPRFFDNLLIGWFRLTRARGIDRRMQVPRITSGLRDIVKFGLTVGLSGFLLAAMVWAFSRGAPQSVMVTGESAELTRERRLILESLTHQEKLIESTQRSLLDIRNRLDRPILITPATTRQP